MVQPPPGDNRSRGNFTHILKKMFKKNIVFEEKNLSFLSCRPQWVNLFSREASLKCPMENK